MIALNKGEWSEAYLVTKILSEGKVHGGMGDCSINSQKIYPIVKILDYDNDIIYNINHELNKFKTANVSVINNKTNEVIAVFEQEELSYLSDKAYTEIIEGKKTFTVKSLLDFFKTIGVDKPKANNIQKSDISMEILDLIMNIQKQLNFSIKSELGSKPTILNASGQTNFIYEIKNCNDNIMNNINNIGVDKKRGWLKSRMSYVLENYEIEYNSISSETFKSNLEIIDTDMDKILAYILLYFYSNEGSSSIVNLLDIIEDKNPLDKCLNKDIFYKKNIIEFIKATAFGLMPSVQWDGKYSVDGGMLVILYGGEIIMYHLHYDLAQLNEYLLNNTKLETPSTTRHKFGFVYKDNNRYYMKLNLQIRLN